MRSGVLLMVGAACAASCAEGNPGGPSLPAIAEVSEFLGTHALRTVGGRTVPFADSSTAPRSGVQGGALEIRADSTFTLWYSAIQPTSCLTTVTDGRVTPVRDSLLLARERAVSVPHACGPVVRSVTGDVMSGAEAWHVTFSGDRLRVAVNGEALAFARSRTAVVAGERALFKVNGASLPFLIAPCPTGGNVVIVAGSLSIDAAGRFSMTTKYATGPESCMNVTESTWTGRISHFADTLVFWQNFETPVEGRVCGQEIAWSGRCDGIGAHLYRP